VRKSRREKEKDAAQAKKREEEENAARAYAEFLDEFDADDVGKRKVGSSFVRASTDPKGAYVPPVSIKSDPPTRPSRANDPRLAVSTRCVYAA
jgi:U2-associated protein SR140